MISEQLIIAFVMIVIISILYIVALTFGYYTGVKQQKRLAEIEEGSRPHFMNETKDPSQMDWDLEPEDIDRIEDWSELEN